MSQYQQQQNANTSTSTSSSGSDVEHDDLQETMGNAAIQEMLNGNSIDPDSVFASAFHNNQERVQNLKITLTESQMQNVRQFQDHWARNRSRYEAVSAKANVPAKLIAALHWRESSGNFNTYLHQGDPLGRPAVNWPNNIPVFHVWEDAAVHALHMKRHTQNELNITNQTESVENLATYAEAYNGLGYHNRGKPSPYVFAGSSAYSSGKYVADGQYSSSHVDQQVGVVPLLGSVDGAKAPTDISPRQQTKEDIWATIVAGHKLLKRGMNGAEVTILQEHLKDLGYLQSVDGDFGPGTESAIYEFQRDNELSVDGLVGSGTATAITQALQNRQNAEANS